MSREDSPPPAYSEISANTMSQQVTKTVKINALWDEKHHKKIDVDLAVTLHDATGRLLDICCFNQTRVANGTVSHSGDKRDGSEREVDENITVSFGEMPAAVSFALVIVTVATKNVSLSDFKKFSVSLGSLGSKDFLEIKEKQARSFVPFAFVRKPFNFDFIDVAHWATSQGLENIWIMCDQVLEKLIDPVLWRERPQSKYDQLNLKKDQNVMLPPSKTEKHKIMVGVGWDVGDGSGFDVDAWCFQMSRDRDTRRLKIHEKIYFNHLKSSDHSVIHGGDNRTGKGSGDDETIKVYLEKVSPHVVALVFAVKIYDDKGLGITFKDIKNEYIRIVNSDNEEIVRYSLDDDETFDNKTCGVFCVLRRIGHSWRVEPKAIATSTLHFDEQLPSLVENNF